MEWDGNNEELRIALDLPDGTLASEHTEKIEKIRNRYPHSIALVQKTGGLTCVPFALELADHPTYRAIASDFEGEVFAGPEFMAWLLEGRIKEFDRPAQGLLGLYFLDSSWRHVGLVGRADRVIGKISHL